MNLDLFNNLINTAKENNFVQGFIKELNEFLEKNLYETKFTGKYKDKMYAERRTILENYAKRTSNKGIMYYIYDKTTKDNSKYLISICEEGRSHEILEANENELPEEVGVGSVLRIKDGKYVLDEEATKITKEEIQRKFNELLKEQSKEMEERRIEGHLYEFVEGSEDTAWLIDKNMPKNDDGTEFDVFEEFNFPKKFKNTAKEGDIFQYINGEYQIYSN